MIEYISVPSSILPIAVAWTKKDGAVCISIVLRGAKKYVLPFWFQVPSMKGLMFSLLRAQLILKL